VGEGVGVPWRFLSGVRCAEPLERSQVGGLHLERGARQGGRNRTRSRKNTSHHVQADHRRRSIWGGSKQDWEYLQPRDSTVQYSPVLDFTVLYCTVLYCTVQ